MKVLVLFDTVTGNTEKIANALARGLGQHATADCLNINAVTDPHLLESYDALLVGAPTHFMTAPRHMKQFLRTLRQANLAGKRGFAFDTRLESRFSGSAGNYIEKELKKAGLKIIRHEGSALIGSKSNQLEAGMEELFEGIGDEIGRMLLNSATLPA